MRGVKNLYVKAISFASSVPENADKMLMLHWTASLTARFVARQAYDDLICVIVKGTCKRKWVWITEIKNCPEKYG